MSINEIASLFLVIVFGGTIGSFLNMLIYRLPIIVENTNKKFTLFLPRSHCTRCKKTLSILHLIPLISFIALRGKCYFCKNKIGLQYLMVEVFCVLMAILIYLFASNNFIFTVSFIFFAYLLALSIIDFKHSILPDQLTLTGLWLGLFFAASQNITGNSFFISANESVLSAICGYAIPFVTNYIFKITKGHDGMGGGDFKMLAMVGAWVGFESLLHTLLSASILAIIFVILRSLFLKVSIRQPMVFGGFIAISAILILLSRVIV
jgi:leader peptidase (prepilin peptidase)/N-methyltransferase